MSVLLSGGPPMRPSDQKQVYARSGWTIPMPSQIPVITDEEIRRRGREWMGWRSNLTIRSFSPYPYNCVGMIFASRRAFIEIDHIYEILAEDGYNRINISQVMAGDIIVYRNDVEPTHVALIVSVEVIGSHRDVRVISKWGNDPEFEHFMENVPDVFGKPVEFWTERVL